MRELADPPWVNGTRQAGRLAGQQVCTMTEWTSQDPKGHSVVPSACSTTWRVTVPTSMPSAIAFPTYSTCSDSPRARMHRANDTLSYRTRCVHVAVARLLALGVL
jgi:hypothetical protein